VLSGLKELVCAGLSQCCRGVQHHLSASPMSSMYHNWLPIYPCLPSLPSAIPSLALALPLPSAKMVKSSSRPVSGHRIGQRLGRTLPALHAPQTAYTAVVAPLTLQLWHECLNHCTTCGGVDH